LKAKAPCRAQARRLQASYALLRCIIHFSAVYVGRPFWSCFKNDCRIRFAQAV